MRRIATIVLVSLALAGCGDALEGIGDLSSDFVHGDRVSTSSTVAATGPDLGIGPITGVIWVNDDLDLTASRYCAGT